MIHSRTNLSTKLGFLVYFIEGNKNALLQGTFPLDSVKIVFTENRKDMATYFNEDGTGKLIVFPLGKNVFEIYLLVNGK